MESLKKPSLLGLLMANPIVIAIILIVLAVLFIFFYVTLAVLGLLTAAIFFVAGLGLLFIVASKSPDTVKSHPLVFFFTPIVLGLFGVLSDKVPSLSNLSLTGDIIGSATSSDWHRLPVCRNCVGNVAGCLQSQGKKKKRKTLNRDCSHFFFMCV